ncbi:hypothetical protein [Butyrivibrio sp. INlla21]|uniref:hypothetical protein n=1 Tax=Butyrivibrio sp. INlla21 TaxID=1520811 RepID=UPI0008EAC15E|nr:hypothetical protein [Butyrivibrio sp. INlla21]SFU35203.1 hypothetical protein SAMN02910342_00199 [Butyrivibrio sp. INlla21]
MIKRKNRSAALLLAFFLIFGFTALQLSPIIAYAETPGSDTTTEENDTNDIKEDDSSASNSSSTSDPSVTNPIPEEKKDTDNDKEEIVPTETKNKNIVSDKEATPEISKIPTETPTETPEKTTPVDAPIVTDIPVEAPKIEEPTADTRKLPTVTYSTANFYILNEINADIPEEPANHSSDNYSSAITIDEAIPNDYRYYSPIVDGSGSEDSLKDDNITAANAVSGYLHNIPTAEDIKNVIPTFDPENQFVIWYVKKVQKSGVHVDGVIRNKASSQEIIPEDYPNVSIEIYTTCEETDIEYDGKEHIIGGFNIVVKDLDNKRPSLRNIFNALGELLTVEAYAGTNGSGTYFSNNGINYWVNIDAAYVVASEIKTYTIPFLFNGKEISPEEISVSYEKDGEWFKLPASVITQQKPTTAKVNVKQRNLTLEAGTTVKNYDGSTITNDKVSITSGSLLEGHKLKNVVINGSQSVIGSSKNEIASFIIVDENGKDVTSLYNVKCVAGKLEFVDDGTYTSYTEDGQDSDPNNIAANAIKKTVITKALEENDADVKVLGATKKLPRMGQTGDETNIAGRIIAIIASTAAIVILSKKKKSII